jgi:hypothetical protein
MICGIENFRAQKLEGISELASAEREWWFSRTATECTLWYMSSGSAENCHLQSAIVEFSMPSKRHLPLYHPHPASSALLLKPFYLQQSQAQADNRSLCLQKSEHAAKRAAADSSDRIQ